MALSSKPVQIVEKKKYPLLIISPHWERVFLKYLADVQNGFAFSSKLFTKNKGMPLIRIRDISNNITENYYDGEYDQNFIVNKGDILIGMDGDFNVSIWRGKPGLLNQRVCRIKLRSEKYSEKFLFICLQPYLNAINAETSSVTVKHLSSRTVEDIPLPLPPLPEQNHLVAKIEEFFSELDNGIESLKKARQQLKTYRQAVLKYAFEGKLTKEWRNQQIQEGNPPEPAKKLLERIRKERETHYKKQVEDWEKACELANTEGKKNPAKPKKPKELLPFTDEELKGLPKLPEGWGWVKLGCVVRKIFDGPFGSNLKTKDYVEEGVRVIRLENIGVLDFINERKSCISEEKYNLIKKHKVFHGDIIFSSFISEQIRVIVLPSYIKKAINKADCFCIRVTKSSLCNKYLTFYLSTRSTYNQLIHQVHGATRPRINTTQLRNCCIPLCSNHEQHTITSEIESRLSVCDKIEQTIEDSLKKTEALRQSILKKAFSGELTKDWRKKYPELISGENSAEKLLEKIRTEKARTDTSRGKPRSKKTKK